MGRVRHTGSWGKHWIYDLIGAGLAMAVGLAALRIPPVALWLEQWSYDLPYALRPSRAVSGEIGRAHV